MLGRFTSQKGFIGRKTLLLMGLVFSLLTFCLLQKLTPSTNISKPTTRISIHQTYEPPKDEQAKLPRNSDLDPRVVNRFLAARQELDSKNIHVEFKWYSTVGKQRWCPNNLQQKLKK